MHMQPHPQSMAITKHRRRQSSALSLPLFDIREIVLQTPLLSSFGRQESVCKVKPESCYGSQKEANVDMDSDVHGYCGDSLTDTIQHLLYAEAQPVKAGDNGWRKPPANWGREFWRAFTFNSPS